MTLEEFSNGFNTLVSSYRRFRDFDNKEPLDTIEFDEFEKSVFLTKAQEEIVLSLYNGRNSSGDSFEETEELRRYLSNLIKEGEITPDNQEQGIPSFKGMEKNSKFFTLPKDLWFITYEKVVADNGKCGSNTSLEIKPVRQDEYNRLKKNPFRGANDRRALRLDLSKDHVEIVSEYNVTKYYLRYLRKLKPIILVNLPNGISIQGESTATECELEDSLHQRILERAVLLAMQSKMTGAQPQSDRQKQN